VVGDFWPTPNGDPWEGKCPYTVSGDPLGAFNFARKSFQLIGNKEGHWITVERKSIREGN
jgi:hypothetical protein